MTANRLHEIALEIIAKNHLDGSFRRLAKLYFFVQGMQEFDQQSDMVMDVVYTNFEISLTRSEASVLMIPDLLQL